MFIFMRLDITFERLSSAPTPVGGLAVLSGFALWTINCTKEVHGTNFRNVNSQGEGEDCRVDEKDREHDRQLEFVG